MFNLGLFSYPTSRGIMHRNKQTEQYKFLIQFSI